MTTAAAADQGLRARKKLATREALSRAAVHLALERGLENVRVDDIAAAAGVSPRTYNNYFASREEAICVALAAERALRVGAALLARPPEEPLAEAVIGALVAQHAGSERDKQAARLIIGTPALRGEYLKTMAALERPLAEAIAARIGTDAEHDLYPRVLAAALSVAVRVATEQWLAADDGTPLAAVLRAALTYLAPAVRVVTIPAAPAAT